MVKTRVSVLWETKIPNNPVLWRAGRRYRPSNTIPSACVLCPAAPVQRALLHAGIERAWRNGLDFSPAADDYRGCPNKPALAANASFCWMWYSWKRMEILCVIFRYFCKQLSEHVVWKEKLQVNQSFCVKWCIILVQNTTWSHTSSGLTSLVVKSFTQSMKQFSVSLL